MPKVDLIAERSFLYHTRRLQAGDAFEAKNAAEAKVLVELAKKARYGRIPGAVAAPPKAVADKIEAAVVPPALTEPKVEEPKAEKPKPVPAVSTRTVAAKKPAAKRTTRKRPAKKG